MSQAEETSPKAESFASRIKAAIRFLLIFVIFALLSGFAAFYISVTSKKPLPEPDLSALKPQGIVVLTGDANRLETAGKLFKQLAAERLLVSGIHGKVPAEDIRQLLSLETQDFNCCVDLDYIAIDTVSNARETASWSRTMGYEHILLITSDYHMIRASIEITQASQGKLHITPYPVKLNRNRNWPDGARIKTLIKEYGKLLITLATYMGHRADAPPLITPQITDISKPDTDDETLIEPTVP